ncbi:MAG: UvrD-helicase domain-containing protein [Prosthecochloris sp.]|nr:UvrD-helicase domain-containing protein [Prosthecochloris sp.]
MLKGNITFISAGAGSGKTTRLTEILYGKLVSGEAAPDGIIATTFTTKAAAELRERVSEKLLEQQEHHLATTMAEARIGTVNSVCGNLLRRYAFELGMTIEQNVLDESSAMVQVSRAVDAAVDAGELEAINRLAHRLGILDSRTKELLWKNHVKDIIDQARANNIDPHRLCGFADDNARELLELFPPPLEDDPVPRLLEAISVLKATIGKVMEQKVVKKTAAYLEELQRFERSLRENSFRWSDWLTMARAEPQKKPLLDHIGGVRELCASVASHPLLQQDIREYLERVFTIASRTLEIYQEQKHELGLVDFTDQEARLLDGLNNPVVRKSLAGKLDLLLVDEFQDTSPVQLALFLGLSELASETYWVGDIKQAIYGFRGGDARLMRAVLEFVPPQRRQVLGNSWRSVPSLVEASNAIFAPAFRDLLDEEEVVLKPCRDEHPRQASCISWDTGRGKLEEQYRSIAAGIVSMVGHGSRQVYDKSVSAWRSLCYGDIAVLARTNSHVRQLAAILREHDVPAATSQPGLLETPEAALVRAALRRIVDPADTLATAELLSFISDTPPEEWIRHRLDDLESGVDPDSWGEEGARAHPVLQALAELRNRAALFSPAEALQAVISTIGAPEQVLAWCRDHDEARTRLLNLQALAGLAEEYEQECRAASVSPTAQGLLVWLDELAHSELDLFPEPPVNAVRVMTFHKSKGLEWPVVVLCDLDHSGTVDYCTPSVVSLQDVDASDPLRGRFIRFWPCPFGTRSGFSSIERVAQSSQLQDVSRLGREESVRLLYVAMTRARDTLVLASPTGSSCSWLELAGAEVLVRGESSTVQLPGGVELQRELSAPDSALLSSTLPALHSQRQAWYAPAPEPSSRQPEQVSPSLLEARYDAVVAEEVVYAAGMSVHTGGDASAFGRAVHDILAFWLTQDPGNCTEAVVLRLLKAYGVDHLAVPGQLAVRLSDFRTYITSRWPGASMHVEASLRQELDGGRVLNGQVDLLLDTPDGWIVIDHKTGAVPSGHRREKALGYTGQLFAYCQALREVTGRRVVGSWVHFLTAGALLRLDVQAQSPGCSS